MKYINPIKDRSEADVAQKTAKAFFNVLDWQRIYGNTQIANYLAAYLLSIEAEFHALTEPTIETIPTVSDLNALLQNIENIRATMYVTSPLDSLSNPINTNWLSGISADSPDYLDANEWEGILDIIIEIINLSADYQVFCGVANTGQPRLYQQRWRCAFVKPSQTPGRYARMNVSTCGTNLNRSNVFRRYD